MSSVNFKTATKLFINLMVFGLLVSFSFRASAWEVDFSRRQVDFDRVSNQDRMPASVGVKEETPLLDKVFEGVEPSQDIVIMNTEKGFVPETLYLRKGGNYKIHVVNVNAGNKNVSFILDAFSEHHNTVFGKTKDFTLTPKADGIFTYQCPETSKQGKIVVAPSDRKPASH